MTRRERFTAVATPTVELRLTAGRARLLPAEDEVVEVVIESRQADAYRVERSGTQVWVEQPGRGLGGSSNDLVELRLPPGAAVTARTTAAELESDVRLGSLSAVLVSGGLRAGPVDGTARVRTASGDVEVGDVGGDLTVHSASGDVTAGRVTGAVEATTASGDVRMDAVGGRLEVRTASGDVRVRRYEGPEVRVRSVSGDLWLGLPPGLEVELSGSTLSGAVRNGFADRAGQDTGPGDRRPVRVQLQSVSGDLVLQPA
ncbi:DUF4097 family beta strand repeat-containing protein [Ornithinicoccus halotolerans]|uniref:DUF4097 family beta strand repeat-containing protein n=1 Tax=Ornithinicoccus halotolerans TaxID=1748220 RepID=UPI0012972EC2|nr:DUF4097 family beta strand repeat-containing protein [Ornithinicoccus halotolerans]